MTDLSKRIGEWHDEWAKTAKYTVDPEYANRDYTAYDELALEMSADPADEQAYWEGVRRIIDEYHDDVETKGVRHVRDADFWGAPEGTPLPLPPEYRRPRVRVRKPTTGGVRVEPPVSASIGEPVVVDVMPPDRSIADPTLPDPATAVPPFTDPLWAEPDAFTPPSDVLREWGEVFPFGFNYSGADLIERATEDRQMRMESVRKMRKNLSWEQVEDRIRLIDILREDNKVVVAQPTGAALSILQGGRIETQFTTETSNGSYFPFARAAAELSMFNEPVSSVESRPVYGYVVTNDRYIVGGAVEQYGSVRMVLKDDVRDRTTFTVGDSLMRGGPIPCPLTGEVSDDRKFAANHGALTELSFIQTSQYVEAQVHGGVTVDDIAEIHVPFRYLKPRAERESSPVLRYPSELSKAIRLARELGIPVLVYKDRYNYGIPLEDLPDWEEYL